MKQRKQWPTAVPTSNPKPQYPNGSLRQEIDQIATQISKIVGKNPKKAAKTVEGWVNGTTKSDSKKRAA